MSTLIPQTVVVTGASSGVGLATARVLAERGAAVVMISRDEARGAAARSVVAAAATGPAPVLMLADFSSQRSVRGLAANLRNQYERIDLLVNNAAAVFRRRELTVDGLERSFAINHLAPFLLTNLLLDPIREASAARIVNVASESYSSSIDFDDLQSERNYNFFRTYIFSKLCNLLFTEELARRLRRTGVTVNAVSPGPTLTSFGRGQGGMVVLMRMLMRILVVFGIAGKPERGARSIIRAATAPELAGVTGKFLTLTGERRTKAITHDLAAAARLWRVSEELCGLPPSVA